MSKCIVRIKEVKSPYRREWRGYRIQVAVPNQCGHKAFSSEPAPSFDPPYLVVQFGDYEDFLSLDKALTKLPAELKRRRFTSYDMID